MGVDPVKPKAAPSVPKTVEPKPVAAPKIATAPPASKKPAEGFDVLKKKLMSVSGRYAAPKAEAGRADLKELVSKKRSAVHAGGLAPPKTDEGKLGAGKHLDTSMGEALDDLAAKNKAPGSISARQLAQAISKGGRDLDGQSAGTEFQDLQKFVKENGKLLSPEAKKAFALYEKAATEANAKGSTAVGSLEEFDALVAKMAAAGPPINMKEGPRGVNDTTDPLKSRSGPITKEEWADPSKLLEGLTQNPAAGETSNSRDACGPSNLLGIALMSGPEGGAKFLENVAKNASPAQLSTDDKGNLNSIAGKLRSGTATREDLATAQGILYRAGNTHRGPDEAVAEALPRLAGADKAELTALNNKPTWSDADARRIGELITKATGSPSELTRDGPGWKVEVAGARVATDKSAYSDDELNNLAKMGGLKPNSTEMGMEDTLKSVFGKLKPGESVVIRVAGEANGDKPDHFVTMGRRADGTAYIYNPDPSNKDATTFIGGKGKPSTAFQAQIAKYEDRVWFDPNGKLPKYTKVSPD